MALWAHAGAVAQAAADHGVERAALLGGSDEAGIAAARDFLANAGSFERIQVVANNPSGSEFVELQVRGSYPSVFGRLAVTASATSVRERLPEP